VRGEARRGEGGLVTQLHEPISFAKETMRKLVEAERDARMEVRGTAVCVCTRARASVACGVYSVHCGLRFVVWGVGVRVSLSLSLLLCLCACVHACVCACVRALCAVCCPH
jgi:hypothetical protein